MTVTVAPTGPAAGARVETVGGSTTENVAALVPVPAAVVTETLFVTAVPGTGTVMCESSSTTKPGATTVPNLTAVAPVNVVPSTSIDVPRVADGGLNPVTLGVTLKLAPLVPMPPGVVTATGPVDAPAGTTAVILVAEMTVNVDAGTPLNVTSVAPVNADPLIVTTAPDRRRRRYERRDGRRGARKRVRLSAVTLRCRGARAQRERTQARRNADSERPPPRKPFHPLTQRRRTWRSCQGLR